MPQIPFIITNNVKFGDFLRILLHYNVHTGHSVKPDKLCLANISYNINVYLYYYSKIEKQYFKESIFQ